MTEVTEAQHVFLTALSDQRVANIIESADFIHDLSAKQKDFLTQADPATLDFLRTLRPDEVKGLQAYLLLRSTSSYLAWGIGAVVGGLVAVLFLWDHIKPFLAVVAVVGPK